MTRSAEIRARIKHLGELQEIVGTMRSMAGVRVQQGHAALDGIRRYTAAIDAALAQAYPLLPARDRAAETARARTGVVAIGSEHGFVGQHNERLLATATGSARGLVEPALLVVGSRAAEHARQSGLRPSWTTAMATHVESVVDVAQSVGDEIYRRVGRGDLQRLLLVFGRSEPGRHGEIVVQQLLPFDFSPYRSGGSGVARPLCYLPAPGLVERLVEEFVFAELMHATMEAFASENDARLATTGAAYDNIEKKVAGLRQEQHVVRQEEITVELLDVITGTEAAGDAP